MAWHKKAGAGSAKPPAKPKTPTVAKPKAPTVPKASVPKPAVAPVSAAKDAKMAKTGTFASKHAHFGSKHGPVNKGHVK